MSDRPYTLLSCSVSLDGYLGDQTPRLALSNEADFDRVDEVRASCDAIMVGAVTVRTDNPRLLVRSQARRDERAARGLAPSPMKITVTEPRWTSTRNRTSSRRATPRSSSTRRARACPTPARGSGRWRRSWTAAGACGCAGSARTSPTAASERLMVEGGGIVHTQFLSDDLVDELQLVVAPFFVGDSSAPRFVSDGRFPWNAGRRATLAEVRQIGDVVLLRYALSPRFRDE